MVAGNLIGTDVSGTYAIPNSSAGDECGVFVGYGAAFNRIGTDGVDADPTGDRNVISGNMGYGGLVILDDFDTTVAGNYIGTSRSGLAALPNSGDGMEIRDGSQGNVIGTNGAGVDDTAERNVISGNDGYGIRIWSSGTSGNVVAGNYVGTNADGTAALGNGSAGIEVFSGATGNWIGVNSVFNPETADDGNLISGNMGDGVEITGTGTTGNVVAGNYIGTDVTGTIAIANHAGVEIDSGATGNLIGTNGAGVSDALERQHHQRQPDCRCLHHRQRHREQRRRRQLHRNQRQREYGARQRQRILHRWLGLQLCRRRRDRGRCVGQLDRDQRPERR